MPSHYASRSASRNTTGAPPDKLRSRALFVVLLLLLWCVGVGARLVYLQVTQHEHLLSVARSQQAGAAGTTAPRGLVVDRMGRELARSVEVPSFYADPKLIDDPADAARRIAPVLDLDAAELTARLIEAKESKRRFVWLRRKCEQSKIEQIAGLNLKGIGVRPESMRVYPHNNLAAHVLGFVGSDETGLGGIEQTQNKRLTSEAGRVFVGMDAKRRAFESSAIEAREGETIVLTIDAGVQYQTEVALAETMRRTNARAGAVVVLDPRTGEVLALANAPNFNPNRANTEAASLRTNEALQNIYEPGSTFKIVAYAGALEEKLTRPHESIDCLGGGINVHGRFVRDHTPYGMLTVTEALAKSSNVAAIKLGQRLGDARLHEYITRFGIGRRTGIDLPGETAGILRPAARWHPSSIGSIAIGQEVGVTPVQMAAAFGAIANDGLRRRPHVVRETRTGEGAIKYRGATEPVRVVSSETARVMRTMLESVTLKGTAKRAQLDGYTAAGKTGTAQKIDPRTRAYSATKHVASFIGFAPAENPEVVIAAVIDEPVGAYHGGDVAAPLFQDVATRILPYLNVVPDGDFKFVPGAEQLAGGGTPESLHSIARVDASMNEVAPQSDATNDSARRQIETAAGDGNEVVFATADAAALVMPDLTGQSVRDAWSMCAQLGLQLEARGEGRAMRQSPAAGATVQSGETITIMFARASE